MSKKIPIDKEFLDSILKKITDLENKINEKPSQVINNNQVGDNYLFECHAIAPYTILPAQQQEFQIKVNNFGEELKVLMKKHNLISANGIFLAKNIN